MGKPGGHSSAPIARWIATADASAAAGSANTARNTSPTVLKTRPPAASICSRTMRLWRADASAMASRPTSHSRTLPSMSVNTNVTMPEGSPIHPLCTPDPARACLSAEPFRAGGTARYGGKADAPSRDGRVRHVLDVLDEVGFT